MPGLILELVLEESIPSSSASPQGGGLLTLRMELCVSAIPHQLRSGASTDNLETCCFLAGAGQVTGLKPQSSHSISHACVLSPQYWRSLCLVVGSALISLLRFPQRSQHTYSSSCTIVSATPPVHRCGLVAGGTSLKEKKMVRVRLNKRGHSWSWLQKGYWHNVCHGKYIEKEVWSGRTKERVTKLDL